MHERKWVGMFIPAAVWRCPEINCVEKCLYAEIKAIGGFDENCYASNEYLGGSVGVSANRASVMVSHLIELGFVRVVKFDGRRRWLAALFDRDSTKADFLKTKRLTRRKQKGSSVENKKSESAKKLENVNRACPEPGSDPALKGKFTGKVYRERIESEIESGLTPTASRSSRSRQEGNAFRETKTPKAAAPRSEGNSSRPALPDARAILAHALTCEKFMPRSGANRLVGSLDFSRDANDVLAQLPEEAQLPARKAFLFIRTNNRNNWLDSSGQPIAQPLAALSKWMGAVPDYNVGELQSGWLANVEQLKNSVRE